MKSSFYLAFLSGQINKESLQDPTVMQELVNYKFYLEDRSQLINEPIVKKAYSDSEGKFNEKLFNKDYATIEDLYKYYELISPSIRFNKKHLEVQKEAQKQDEENTPLFQRGGMFVSTRPEFESTFSKSVIAPEKTLEFNKANPYSRYEGYGHMTRIEDVTNNFTAGELALKNVYTSQEDKNKVVKFDGEYFIGINADLLKDTDIDTSIDVYNRLGGTYSVKDGVAVETPTKALDKSKLIVDYIDTGIFGGPQTMRGGSLASEIPLSIIRGGWNLVVEGGVGAVNIADALSFWEDDGELLSLKNYLYMQKGRRSKLDESLTPFESARGFWLSAGEAAGQLGAMWGIGTMIPGLGMGLMTTSMVPNVNSLKAAGLSESEAIGAIVATTILLAGTNKALDILDPNVKKIASEAAMKTIVASARTTTALTSKQKIKEMATEASKAYIEKAVKYTGGLITGKNTAILPNVIKSGVKEGTQEITEEVIAESPYFFGDGVYAEARKDSFDISTIAKDAGGMGAIMGLVFGIPGAVKLKKAREAGEALGKQGKLASILMQDGFSNLDKSYKKNMTMLDELEASGELISNNIYLDLEAKDGEVLKVVKTDKEGKQLPSTATLYSKEVYNRHREALTVVYDQLKKLEVDKTYTDLMNKIDSLTLYQKTMKTLFGVNPKTDPKNRKLEELAAQTIDELYIHKKINNDFADIIFGVSPKGSVDKTTGKKTVTQKRSLGLIDLAETEFNTKNKLETILGRELTNADTADGIIQQIKARNANALQGDKDYRENIKAVSTYFGSKTERTNAIKKELGVSYAAIENKVQRLKDRWEHMKSPAYLTELYEYASVATAVNIKEIKNSKGVPTYTFDRQINRFALNKGDKTYDAYLNYRFLKNSRKKLIEKRAKQEEDTSKELEAIKPLIEELIDLDFRAQKADGSFDEDKETLDKKALDKREEIKIKLTELINKKENIINDKNIQTLKNYYNLVFGDYSEGLEFLHKTELDTLDMELQPLKSTINSLNTISNLLDKDLSKLNAEEKAEINQFFDFYLMQLGVYKTNYPTNTTVDIEDQTGEINTLTYEQIINETIIAISVIRKHLSGTLSAEIDNNVAKLLVINDYASSLRKEIQSKIDVLEGKVSVVSEAKRQNETFKGFQKPLREKYEGEVRSGVEDSYLNVLIVQKDEDGKNRPTNTFLTIDEVLQDIEKDALEEGEEWSDVERVKFLLNSVNARLAELELDRNVARKTQDFKKEILPKLLTSTSNPYNNNALDTNSEDVGLDDSQVVRYDLDGTANYVVSQQSYDRIKGQLLEKQAKLTVLYERAATATLSHKNASLVSDFDFLTGQIEVLNILVTQLAEAETDEESGQKITNLVNEISKLEDIKSKYYTNSDLEKDKDLPLYTVKDAEKVTLLKKDLARLQVLLSRVQTTILTHAGKLNKKEFLDKFEQLEKDKEDARKRVVGIRDHYSNIFDIITTIDLTDKYNRVTELFTSALVPSYTQVNTAILYSALLDLSTANLGDLEAVKAESEKKIDEISVFPFSAFLIGAVGVGKTTIADLAVKLSLSSYQEAVNQAVANSNDDYKIQGLTLFKVTGDSSTLKMYNGHIVFQIEADGINNFLNFYPDALKASEDTKENLAGRKVILKKPQKGGKVFVEFVDGKNLEDFKTSKKIIVAAKQASVTKTLTQTIKGGTAVTELEGDGIQILIEKMTANDNKAFVEDEFEDAEILVIDEATLVNKEQLASLSEAVIAVNTKRANLKTRKPPLKVLFVGDPSQSTVQEGLSYVSNPVTEEKTDITHINSITRHRRLADGNYESVVIYSKEEEAGLDEADKKDYRESVYNNLGTKVENSHFTIEKDKLNPSKISRSLMPLTFKYRGKNKPISDLVTYFGGTTIDNKLYLSKDPGVSYYHYDSVTGTALGARVVNENTASTALQELINLFTFSKKSPTILVIVDNNTKKLKYESFGPSVVVKTVEEAQGSNSEYVFVDIENDEEITKTITGLGTDNIKLVGKNNSADPFFLEAGLANKLNSAIGRATKHVVYVTNNTKFVSKEVAKKEVPSYSNIVYDKSHTDSMKDALLEASIEEAIISKDIKDPEGRDDNKNEDIPDNVEIADEPVTETDFFADFLKGTYSKDKMYYVKADNTVAPLDIFGYFKYKIKGEDKEYVGFTYDRDGNETRFFPDGTSSLPILIGELEAAGEYQDGKLTGVEYELQRDDKTGIITKCPK